MAHRWPLWTRQLVAVGARNRVSYSAMARALGVNRTVVAGILYRGRMPHAQRPPVRRFHAHAISVSVDASMLADLRAVQGDRPMAVVIRELIEWGLEAHHNG